MTRMVSAIPVNPETMWRKNQSSTQEMCSLFKLATMDILTHLGSGVNSIRKVHLTIREYFF